MDRLAYSVEEVASLLGLGSATAWRLVQTGELPSIRLRSRRLVPARALDALLQPADTALEQFPLLKLPQSSGFYLQQGQPVLVPNAPCDGMVRVALETGEFLGLGEILNDGRVAPRRLVASNA